MLSYTQAIIIGLVQGISELFPISSLGHIVIIPAVLGWHIQQNNSFFLDFLVATHLATAIVLFCFFWNDWKKIIMGMGRSLAQRSIAEDNYAGKLGWALVVGTIPAGIIGLLFQDQLQLLFASAKIAAFCLILNGILLFGAERLRKKAPPLPEIAEPDKRLARVTWKQAFGVGIAQVIALIPGFSRSGATMAGGLFVGLSNEEAARYSFLLATPIIGAAALLKIPQLFTPMLQPLLGPVIVGFCAAALGAYASVKFLVRFFRTHTLTPFALYCFIAGVVYSLILFLK